MKKLILGIALVMFFSCERENLTKETNTLNNESVLQKNKNGCLYNSFIPSDADFVVNSVNELKNAINNSENGNVIYLSDDVDFVVSENDLPIIINKSIKLVSGRNYNELTGAKVYSHHPGKTLFSIETNDVTFSGLRIIGYDTEVGDDSYNPAITIGIAINDCNNLIVENCEISGWSYAGVFIKNSKNNIIKNNHIHHNRRYGLGYGVVVHNDSETETNAIITCNYFEFNRHDIAGSGSENQSYEASFNTIGKPGVNTHRFDMHGKNGDTEEVAGRRIDIHDNIFEYDNNFVDDKGIRYNNNFAVVVRGVPEEVASIHNNVFSHKCKRYAIKQSKLKQTINQENWISMDVFDNQFSDESAENINLNNFFLIVNHQNEIMRYDFGNECSCYNDLSVIGHGFNNYRKFLVGNWTGNGTDDLIALSNDNKLVLFPFNNNTFYGQGGGVVVGQNFQNYKKFLVGNWTGNGTDDLIALTDDDKLVLFPFNHDTIDGQGGGIVVGHGFNNFKEFFVGNWTGNGTDDLIALTDDDKLVLFPFNNNTFYGQGGGTIVGHGFHNYKKFLVGNWASNGTDDLIALTNDDKLVLFPFNDNTFYGQTNPVIGNGFGNYKDFIIHKNQTNGIDQLIGINKSNQVEMFYLTNSLNGPNYIGCIENYKIFLNGRWK